MHKLHELKEMLCEELKRYGHKDLTAGSLEVVDRLAHTIKNLDKIIDEYDDGYSMRSRYYYDGEDGERHDRSYNNQHSMARRRDSMGRYSGRRYSRDGLADKLRELMEEAPDDHSKEEIRKLADRMEGK